MSILKMPVNNDLLGVYCHSNLQAKKDEHPRNIQHLKLLVFEGCSSLSVHIWHMDSWAFPFTQGTFILLETTRKMPKLALFAM